jgi:hypothetical protein
VSNQARPSREGSFLRMLCFILRGGSVCTPTTGTITQFTRRDEEIGSWNVNEGSGRVANVKRVFVPTGNSADQKKLDRTVGATKRQKGYDQERPDETVDATKWQSRTKASPFSSEDSATQETSLCLTEDYTQETSDGTLGSSDCLIKYSGVSGESENPQPGTQEDLTKIGQEGRNRKATKPDDAEVPQYIWYDHVFEDGARKWTEDQKKAFPYAARILQEAMLKFWTKRVRRSFLAWLRAKYEDLAELDKKYARCVEFPDGRWHFVELPSTASFKERSRVWLAGYR